MTRRTTNQRNDSAPVGTVTVHRRQVTRYAGPFVAEITETETGITVRRKRDSGGKYDVHFYPYDRVVSYAAGEGGSRRSDVHALVYDHVLLARYTGEMSRDADNTVTVTIEDRETGHPLQVVIPWHRDDSLVVNVSEETEKPEPLTREERAERRRAAPAPAGGDDLDDLETEEPLADSDTYDDDGTDDGARPEDDDLDGDDLPADPPSRPAARPALVAARGRRETLARTEAPRGRTRDPAPPAPPPRGTSRSGSRPAARTNGVSPDNSWFTS